MTSRYDAFDQMDRWLAGAMRQVPTNPGLPLDLYRDGDHFIAKIDLPGVDPASIDIDIEDRTLTVRAERKAVEGTDLQWLSHERPVGTFARQLTLGYGVAADRINADYVGGVLTLTIPVAEEAKPRKIAVTSGEAPRVISGD